MDKQELNVLVEKIIRIRDDYKMSMSDRDALADACNVIYHNIDTLAPEGGGMREKIKELIAIYARTIEQLTEDAKADGALCNSFIVGKINGLSMVAGDLSDILEEDGK